jgi:uncharacterized protein involved in response to NO
MDPRTPRPTTAAFLCYGFRPFFMGAALWSAAALALWVLALMGAVALPSRFDPLSWHIHEMLFGFVGAAIAGFLLTAIPNWTQRPPLRGALLASLAALWLLGRIACLGSAFVPAPLAVAADLAFWPALLVSVTRELALGRSWRNLPLLVPLTVMAVADLLMHVESLGGPVMPGLGWRLGLAAVVTLISVIAGRIVPSFTTNWLGQQGKGHLPDSPRHIDRLALAALHAGTLSWVFLPGYAPVGALLVAAALLNGWRLWRWRGLATRSEPLLLVLHGGYTWLVVGTALLGLSILDPGIPPAAAIHALTAGAIGTMVLAVMTRATRGHTGRALRADAATSTLYACVTLAALLRVAAAFTGPWASPLLVASAGLWMAAYLGFAACYGPALLTPRLAGP